MTILMLGYLLAIPYAFVLFTVFDSNFMSLYKSVYYDKAANMRAWFIFSSFLWPITLPISIFLYPLYKQYLHRICNT